MATRVWKLALIAVFAFVVGAFVGFGSYARFVTEPARDALQVALQDETSQFEGHAISIFRQTSGATSIAVQLHLIRFVRQREQVNWMNSPDARRAIGMAMMRIAVEHSIAGDKEAYKKAFDEASQELRAAGLTYKPNEVFDVVRREKKVGAS